MDQQLIAQIRRVLEIKTRHLDCTPFDNLADRLKKEIETDTLSIEDEILVSEYFRLDLEQSKNRAFKCYEYAKGYDEGIFSGSDFIDQAISYLMRACEDLRYIRNLNPAQTIISSDRTYSKMSKELDGLKKNLKVCYEFPEIIPTVIAFQEELDEAVSDENFEYATKVRDKFEEFLEAQTDYVGPEFRPKLGEKIANEGRKLYSTLAHKIMALF